ncbi:hypothetical protein [Aromatoleum buckelii]|uniref:Uncharacterized protein n=1 Tax=Aromatoleum buckelii TaxID=200254 RepID=A0ABX1MWW0_9RHOO|nr:hypothetical protein [Aromatoleum buckelii]MCK0512904.1 hypothetical protein [Aromatoleum buckelii]
MSLHIELGAAIEKDFGERLAVPIEQKQDALIATLENGVTLTIRYAAPDAYSLRWTHGDAEAGIDTAPLHRDLATFPNHLHDVDGRVHADPVTRPDQAPAHNVAQLIRALLENPMLGIDSEA